MLAAQRHSRAAGDTAACAAPSARRDLRDRPARATHGTRRRARGLGGSRSRSLGQQRRYSFSRERLSILRKISSFNFFRLGPVSPLQGTKPRIGHARGKKRASRFFSKLRKRLSTTSLISEHGREWARQSGFTADFTALQRSRSAAIVLSNLDFAYDGSAALVYVICSSQQSGARP